MGNKEPVQAYLDLQLNSQLDKEYRITYHSHENINQLLRIFRLFLNEPYKYIHSIELQLQKQSCCDKTILKVKSLKPTFNLENLLAIKRGKKISFTEREIWYIAKSIINNLNYMENSGISLGVFTPNMFNLEKGKFLRVQILHVMPENQHQKNMSLYDHYSPEKLRFLASFASQPPKQPPKINFFKSEIFSFGLLALQITTCPMQKPKFHKSNLKDILWKQIFTRLQIAKQKYSEKLTQFIQMTLREDIRIRPDWNYLKTWMIRNESYVDIAPCVFWTI